MHWVAHTYFFGCACWAADNVGQMIYWMANIGQPIMAYISLVSVQHRFEWYHSVWNVILGILVYVTTFYVACKAVYLQC